MGLVARSLPLPVESPAGYLLRLAEANGLLSPIEVCGGKGARRLPLEALFSSTYLTDLPGRLGISPDLLDRKFYRMKGPARTRVVKMPSGDEIPNWFIDWRNPKICRACLAERPILRAEWDLTLQAVCLEHRAFLASDCANCDHPLSWQRGAVDICPKCGHALSAGPVETPSENSMELGWAVHRAFEKIEVDRTSPVLRLVEGLALADLLNLIRLLGGEPNRDSGDLRGRRSVKKTDVGTVFVNAAEILGAWPAAFWRLIEMRRTGGGRSSQEEKKHRVVVQWFRKQDREKFKILHQALDEMDMMEWEQGRRLNEKFDKKEFVTRDYAIRVMRLSGHRIQKAIDDGEIASRVFDGEKYKRTYLRRKDLTGKFSLDNKVDDCCSFSQMIRTLNIYWVQGNDLIAAQFLTPISIGNRNVVFSNFEIENLLEKLERLASRRRSPNKSGIPLNRAVGLVTPLTISDVLSAIFAGELRVAATSNKIGFARLYLNQSELVRFAETTQLQRGWVSRAAVMDTLCCTADALIALAKAGYLKGLTPASNGAASYFSLTSVKQFSARYVCTSEITRSHPIGAVAARLKMVKAGYDPEIAVPSREAQLLLWGRADVLKVFPKIGQLARARMKACADEHLIGSP